MHYYVRRYDLIGNVTLTGEIGSDLNGLDPWSTFSQVFTDRLDSQVKKLNSDETFSSIRRHIMIAVDELHRLSLSDFSHLPFLFTHCHLTAQNFLVSDDELPQIAAIVDWEWPGSFPCSEEYFLSYLSILKNDRFRDYLSDEVERRHVLTPRMIT